MESAVPDDPQETVEIDPRTVLVRDAAAELQVYMQEWVTRHGLWASEFQQILLNYLNIQVNAQVLFERQQVKQAARGAG
jgi:hypothetical protein